MKGFAECKCRLCKKVFCCKNCRTGHEEKAHEIYADCDFCLNGRAILKTNTPLKLLEHIKNSHWPLNCVFCKRLFVHLDDLIKFPVCFCLSKMPGTPGTPSLTGEASNNEPSPLLTPFNRNGAPWNNQQLGVQYAMAVTSTPLNNENNKDESQVTPIEIKFIYKSSLKLTASSSGTLNDSKKNDRKVTFCETPIVEFENKDQKESSTPKEKPVDANDSESFYSLANNTNGAEEEGKENTAPASNSTTQWHSALSDGGSKFYSAKKIGCFQDESKKILVASEVQIVETSASVDREYQGMSSSLSNSNTTLWKSMTSMIRSVMHNLSVSAHSSFSKGGKRSKPDFQDSINEDVPKYKRMKLTDIKCRRSIRHLSPLSHIRQMRKIYVDKATQTDDIF